MILTNTVWGPTHDLAVLRVRGSEEGLAVAVSGPGRYAARDAYSGGLAAVSRVMGLLATQGAMALGLTDGINAGNPDKEHVFLDLTHLIAGIADASQGFGVPVTGGNVSLHNETEGEPIWPTAIIGAVGRHLHPLHPTNDAPWKAGLNIIRLSAASDLNLGGSVFEMLHSELSAYPRPDISKLADMYELLIASNQESLEYGARLVGDGGLFVALTKSLLASPANLGMEITVSKDETTQELFSEVMGQMLLFTEPSTTEHWVSVFRHHNIAVDLIGHVTDSPTMVIRAGRSYVFDRTELDRTFRQGYGG